MEILARPGLRAGLQRIEAAESPLKRARGVYVWDSPGLKAGPSGERAGFGEERPVEREQAKPGEERHGLLKGADERGKPNSLW